MTKLLSFQAIAQAYDLIPELRKAEVLLAAPDCGLTGVGRTVTARSSRQCSPLTDRPLRSVATAFVTS